MKKIYFLTAIAMMGSLMAFAQNTGSSTKTKTDNSSALRTLEIIYVNDTATGSNTGTSWADAFTSFQSALDAATYGDSVWVATGTYKPDTTYNPPNSSRYYHFRMIEGVSIYGGFAGTEDPLNFDLNDRDFVANETILSGDLLGNDSVSGSGATLSITNNSENCYHVFYHPNGYVLTNTALLDGFTIKGGNANVSGPHDRAGGMYSYNTAPIITNVTFLNNAARHGGGMWIYKNAPTLTNVAFLSNYATVNCGGLFNQSTSNQSINDAIFQSNYSVQDGGGMANNSSSPTITNIVFRMNSAGNDGGGMVNYYSSSPTIINATFQMNSAPGRGGGMYNSDHSSPTIINAEFSSNSGGYGGGLFNYLSSNPVFTNATFSGNNGTLRGGGVYCFNSCSPTFKNCIIWGNTTTPGINGQQFGLDGGTTTLNFCCYANETNDVTLYHTGDTIATNNNITNNPKFVDPKGDFTIHGNSPCVNTGNSDYNSESYDIRGEARIQNSTIDMGAYEWTSGMEPLTDTVFVKAGATGDNTGTSWTNAFTSFQSALDLAVSGDQVWVAAGTYKPSYDYGLDIGERGKHFRMIEGVSIYGGFAGTEDSVSQRTDFDLGGIHETILSGDIGIVGDSTDNCYHVFYHPAGLNLTGAAILDGFTITGGYADGAFPHSYGGGMYNYNSSPTIANAIFLLNSADYAGGMANRYSSPTITNTTFLSNYGTHAGGMYNSFSSPMITNTLFLSNSTYLVGGGMSNSNYSNPTISNAVFSFNSASNGGGMFNDGNSSPTITNTTFNLNSANRGGCMYNYGSSSPTLNNCIVWGNTATIEGKQIYLDGDTCTLNYCCYANETNDVTIVNGGILTASNNNITSNPKFVDPWGDFRIYAFSPCVNAGNNDYNTQTYDIRGEARIQDTTIDMGAYEWTSGLDPAVQTFYVNYDASGNNNGASWANAFTSLQSALELAAPGEQIWVAAGTYEPAYDYGLNIEPPDTARGYHFRMIEGVAIYGGFAGTETVLSQRTDFGMDGTNETILSGDIGTVGDNTDNCYHVFYHPANLNLTGAAILNGFTITGGNADGTDSHDRGGGMMNDGPCSPTITNVSFKSNAADSGGGMFNSGSDPDLTNVIFLLNTAVQSGGGMHNDSSSPTITNVTFSMNSADSLGGGIYNLNSSPSFFNSIVWGNTASAGRQLYMDGGSTSLNYSCYANGSGDTTAVNSAVFTVTNNNITADPKFVNPVDDLRLFEPSPCVNTGNNDYNLASTDISGEARIQDTTIDMGAYEWTFGADPYGIYYVKHDAAPNNDGTSWADAFTSLQSALDLSVSGDQVWVAAGTYEPSYDYGLNIPAPDTARGYHFRMIEEVAIYGGFAGTEDPLTFDLADRDFVANKTILSGDLSGDDIFDAANGGYQGGSGDDNCYHVFFHPEGLNLTGAAILNGFTITGGNADGTDFHLAGGGMFNYYSSPSITNTAFSLNSASAGGGMCNLESSPAITHSVFSSNSASDGGGGMYNVSNSSPTITNATFSLNSADDMGGGMLIYFSSPSINNCIVWGNTASEGGKQLYILGDTTTLNYSCYANGPNDVETIIGTNTATNCITSDPLLSEDFNLTWTNSPNPAQMSPCIDSGDPLDWLNKPADRDPDGSRMDMGAFYFHQAPVITAYNAGFDTINYYYQYWDFDDVSIPYTSNPKSFVIRNDANHFIDCPVVFTGENPEQFKMEFPGDIYLSDTSFQLEPYEEKSVNVVFQPSSPLTQTADFTVGDITHYTDSVHVEGKGESTGAVIGDVLTPTSEGVQDVTITVEALQSPWTSLTTTTNSSGHYQLVNIGAGNFSISPSKIQDSVVHGFDPETVEFYITERQTHPQNFVDTSFFTVSGNISYRNSSCPAIDIPILMDGLPAVPPISTDSLGNYTVENVLIGSHTFMPDTTTSGHQFYPQKISAVILDSVAGFNFEDKFTHNLSGYVAGAGIPLPDSLGGGCSVPLDDSIALYVECRNPCGISETIYTDSYGFYSINLAPFQYNIVPEQFQYYDYDWISFDTAHIDLSQQDSVCDFIYHSDPLIEMIWPDTLPMLNGVIILKQFEIYAIEIDVLEPYGGEGEQILCRVDTGAIVITDELSDFDQDSIMSISDSVTLYYFQAGYPNIVPPYKKKIKVQYTSEEGKNASTEKWVYVTGILPRGTAFATTTPEIPLLILRDPPGDKSYCELTETTEVSQAISFSTKYNSSQSTFSKISLGLDFEVNTWLFGKLDIETTLDYTTEMGMSMSQNSLTENQLKFTTSDSYKTSESEILVGGKADIYMGGAMNLLYGISDVLTIEDTEIMLDTSIIIVPKGFATTYIYTENHIETTVIPSLYLIQDTVSARRWESFIALNDSLKEVAIFNENVDFNAGASKTLSLNTTRSSSHTQEFELTVDKEVAMEAGLEVNGIGASGGYKISMAMSCGSSVTQTSVNSTKIDYKLDDNDIGEEGEVSDDFSVDILTDPVYGTPVFKTVAGNTMCPWEGPPTNSRKGCAFSQPTPDPMDSIPGGEAAIFTLWLNNTSQTEEYMTYILKVRMETNPYNATFEPAGLTLPAGIEYPLEYGNPQQVNISIYRPDGEFYDLEGLIIELSGDCEVGKNVYDQATIDVHWIHPCSPITIFSPNNGWVVNQANNNVLQVTMKDYDLTNPNLQAIGLEYSMDNGNNWIEIDSIPVGSISPILHEVDLDVSNLADGGYQIRATAECAEDKVNYSERRIGNIDRNTPLVLDNAQPADSVLNIGDEISISFNEELKASTVTINSCRLLNTETGLPISSSIFCDSNKVVFTVNPGNAYFIENRYLTSQVVGVTDIYGNPLADTACWTFRVDQGPLHWNPDNFPFTINDGDSISFSSTLDNASSNQIYYSLMIPDWLSATPNSGYLDGAGDAEDIDFMSIPLHDVFYSDTIFASTVGYPDEMIFVTVSQGTWVIHTVNLSEGWSGMSSYIMPADTNIANVYAPVAPELIIAQTMSGIYYPAGPINTIGNWQTHSAYKVKTNAGVSLDISGILEENKTVDLENGWNLIPVISSCPVDAETLFAPVESDLVIVKEVAGYGVYWPAMGINNLGTLNPGEAYYVRTTDSVPITFDACLKSAVIKPKFNFQANQAWNPVAKTASNHVIGIKEKAMLDFEPGDYIGVFTQDGTCAGQIIVDAMKQQIALVAFGNDAYAAQQQGFEAGDEFVFKLYEARTGDEYNLIPEFDLSQPGGGAMFTENGISVITDFKVSETGMSGGLTSDILIFPNPTNGRFTIQGVAENALIEIFDLRGQQIQCEFGEIGNGIEINLSGRQTGIYIVRILSEGQYVYRKLILD